MVDEYTGDTENTGNEDFYGALAQGLTEASKAPGIEKYGKQIEELMKMMNEGTKYPLWMQMVMPKIVGRLEASKQKDIMSKAQAIQMGLKFEAMKEKETPLGQYATKETAPVNVPDESGGMTNAPTGREIPSPQTPPTVMGALAQYLEKRNVKAPKFSFHAPGTIPVKEEGGTVTPLAPLGKAKENLPNLGKLQEYRQSLIDSGKPLDDTLVVQTDNAIKKLTEGTPKNQTPYIDPKGNTILVDVSSPDAQKIITDKKLKPLQEKIAEIRLSGFEKSRGVSMYDTQTESFSQMNYEDINAENKANPGRYIPSAQAVPVMQKQAVLKEIQTASQITRNALNGLKKDFNATQRAQFAKVLSDPVPMSALDAFVRGSVGKTLDPDQVEYMRSILNLRESSFALRNVTGMGQGSDMLRGAIANAIPGAATFSKAEAKNALDKFDIQVNVLRTGLPGKDITSRPVGNIETKVLNGVTYYKRNGKWYTE